MRLLIGSSARIWQIVAPRDREARRRIEMGERDRKVVRFNADVGHAVAGCGFRHQITATERGQ